MSVTPAPPDILSPEHADDPDTTYGILPSTTRSSTTLPRTAGS